MESMAMRIKTPTVFITSLRDTTGYSIAIIRQLIIAKITAEFLEVYHLWIPVYRDITFSSSHLTILF